MNKDTLAYHSTEILSPQVETEKELLNAYNETIKQMVNQFLGWKVPDDFSPDNGIVFTPSGYQVTGIKELYWPTGTNLLHAGQAEEMFKSCFSFSQFISVTKNHGVKNES